MNILSIAISIYIINTYTIKLHTVVAREIDEEEIFKLKRTILQSNLRALVCIFLL